MNSRDYEPRFRSAYNNGYINGIKQGEAVELARILELLEDKRADIDELDALVRLIKENANE